MYMICFALKPQERLKYMKDKNEKFLQKIAKSIEKKKPVSAKDAQMLIQLIEGVIINARSTSGQNEIYIKEMKEFLSDDRLEYLMDKLGVDICTVGHYCDC